MYCTAEHRSKLKYALHHDCFGVPGSDLNFSWSFEEASVVNCLTSISSSRLLPETSWDRQREALTIGNWKEWGQSLRITGLEIGNWHLSSNLFHVT